VTCEELTAYNQFCALCLTDNSCLEGKLFRHVYHPEGLDESIAKGKLCDEQDDRKGVRDRRIEMEAYRTLAASADFHDRSITPVS
jgi:hypothetical protein